MKELQIMVTVQESFINACEDGGLAAVKNIIRLHGDDISTYHNNAKALLFAAKNGHLDIVKFLAEENQADTHANNELALQYAAIYGHLKIVKYLVEEHHASIHADNEYPIRRAAGNGHLDISLYLVDQGAKYDVLKEEKEDGTPYIYEQIKIYVQEKELYKQQQQQQQKELKQRNLQKLNIDAVKNILTRKAVRRRPTSLKM